MGKYVCFEGVDGSGKSTLVCAVRDRLLEQSISVVPYQFPSEGVVSGMIRRYLEGKETLRNNKALLYMHAADGYVQDHELRAALAEAHVLCDRHPVLAGRIFQLEHHEKHHHVDMVLDTVELLVPDLLVTLDVPAGTTIERCGARSKYRDVIYESQDLEYLRRIRRRYQSMTHAARSRGWARETLILDGRRPIKELVDDVVRIAGLE
jgi:dTMP kinase